MQVDGVPYRTIWLSGDGRTVDIIDQTLLPHDFRIRRLETLEDAGLNVSRLSVPPLRETPTKLPSPRA